MLTYKISNPELEDIGQKFRELVEKMMVKQMMDFYDKIHTEINTDQIEKTDAIK